MDFSLEAATALARRHVCDGTRLIAEQTLRVSLMAEGSDQLRAAWDMLTTMKATQSIFVADLERLERQVPSRNRPP